MSNDNVNRNAGGTLWDLGCNAGFKNAGGFKKGIMNLPLVDDEGNIVYEIIKAEGKKDKPVAVSSGIKCFVAVWHGKNGNLVVQFGDQAKKDYVKVADKAPEVTKSEPVVASEEEPIPMT